MQSQVGTTLEALGYAYRSEGTTAPGYSVDCMLYQYNQLPYGPVALEVDGPHHFLHVHHQGGTQYWPSGSTVLKRRQVAALGIRLVYVAFYEWDACLTAQSRCRLLAAKLAARPM